MNCEDKWLAYYEKAKEYYMLHGDLFVPAKYEIDGIKLGDWLRRQRNTTDERKKKLLNDIGMVWNAIDSRWVNSYKIAVDYYKKHGNLIITDTYSNKDNRSLYVWVYKQKVLYNDGLLEKEKVDLLNSLNINWNVNEVNDYKWDSMYKKALMYYKEHGNLIVPTKYETEDNGFLGVWIANQRKAIKENKLSIERINRLNEIGMVWDVRVSRDVLFNYAKKYYMEHGDLLVPKNYVVDGINLGDWIHNLRNAYYNKNACKLDGKFIKDLEDIGMSWSARKSIWFKNYKRLLEFLNNNGYKDVPFTCRCDDGFYLGNWYYGQLEKLYKGDLGAEESEFMSFIVEKISCNRREVKNIMRLDFNEYYKELLEYYNSFGNINVNSSYVTPSGIKLGNWIKRCRSNYKSGKLSEEEIDKLNILGMVWQARIDDWDIPYSYALEYYREHGNLKVPVNYLVGDNFYLRRWIANQKKLYKNGKLSLVQVKKLEDIGIVWNSYGELWFKYYDACKDYFKEHGDLLIPKDYVSEGLEIGSWIVRQREAYFNISNKSISDERVTLLNEIGMVWSLNEYNFNDMYLMAKDYYDKHGNLLVHNNSTLRAWVNYQRSSLSNPKNNNDLMRIKLLNEIGMVWDKNIYDADWMIMYTHAKTYFDDHGDLLIPRSYVTVDNLRLGKWINTQRNNYRTGKLNETKINLLNDIKMVWNAKVDNFDLMYKKACEYCMEHQHLDIPSNYEVDGLKLGSWIQRLRSCRRKNKLSKDTIEKLDSIGMIWQKYNSNLDKLRYERIRKKELFQKFYNVLYLKKELMNDEANFKQLKK